MATVRARAFHGAIQTAAAPPLRARGFAFDGRATFRRRLEHPGRWALHIVHFQMGQRSMEGQFTVNLAVYHPALSLVSVTDRPTVGDCPLEMRRRLGFFLHPPMDRWWPLFEDDPAMTNEISGLIPLLVDEGLPWLEDVDSGQRIAAVRAIIEHRRRRHTGEPGVDGPSSDRP